MHCALDQTVFAAYGWPADLTTQEILARLLALNHERAAAQVANADKKSARGKRRKSKALDAQSFDRLIRSISQVFLLRVGPGL